MLARLVIWLIGSAVLLGLWFVILGLYVQGYLGPVWAIVLAVVVALVVGGIEEGIKEARSK